MVASNGMLFISCFVKIGHLLPWQGLLTHADRYGDARVRNVDASFFCWSRIDELFLGNLNSNLPLIRK